MKLKAYLVPGLKYLIEKLNMYAALSYNAALKKAKWHVHPFGIRMYRKKNQELIN
jgi:hypothetical protein